MNKCLTKINNKWFERLESKFTEEEKNILQQEKDEELRSEIFNKFKNRSLKLAEEKDIIIAENILINNKITDCYIANVILATKHGFAICASGWVRF